MYDVLTLWRVPILFFAGAFAGWLGARQELRWARGSEDGQGSGLLIRTRVLRYSVSLYLIFATLSLCGTGLYASHHLQHFLPAKSLIMGLFPGSVQSLTTGAFASCLSALHFVRLFSEKYGLDVW